MTSTRGSRRKLSCQPLDHNSQLLGPLFSIYVRTSTDVDDFHDEIFEKLPSEARPPGTSLKSTDLRLWKVSLQLRVLCTKKPSPDWIFQIGGGMMKTLMTHVGCSYSYHPRKCVHLVVRVPQVDVVGATKKRGPEAEDGSEKRQKFASVFRLLAGLSPLLQQQQCLDFRMSKRGDQSLTVARSITLVLPSVYSIPFSILFMLP